VVLGRLFHGSAQDADGKPSMRERLHAWWEGYELPAHAAAPREDGGPGAPATAAPPAAPIEDRWSASRVRVAETVWGSGFSFPGGADYVLRMVKPFGLNPKKSMLDMGCGLGGATRAIAKTYDTWVLGLDSSPTLAAAGQEQSEKAGLGKRATIESFDPDTIVMQPRKYDCVFVRQVLCPVADKTRLLEQLDASLKPGGHIMIVEFVVASVTAASPALAAWRAAEDHPPRPWTLDELRRGLEALNLDVRIAEDVTAEFRTLVLEGWAQLAQSLAGAKLAPEDGKALVHETELWRLRVAALDSGDLRLARLYAIKRGG
jgi:SAM-dependent methyltransferase